MNNVSLEERLEVRGEVRRTIELEAIVSSNEPEDCSWKEIASVTSVSRNGIGFTSPRPCEVGRLVTLALPMPEEFRAYDRSKELYAVNGLVQYCTEISIDDQQGYNVGVALIGKKTPESYHEDPLQTYRINGMTKNGFWTIAEAERVFKPRRYPRYLISLEVGVSLLQKETRSVVRNTAVTRDLGIGGAAILSTLDAQVGDKVKFAFDKLNFYALAIVRNREELGSEESLLRLEFLEIGFPVDKLHLVKDERVKPKDLLDEELLTEGEGDADDEVEFDPEQVADDVEVV